MHKGPMILLIDIETAPILGHVWQLWDQNVALNQIKSDWHLLSWSAKWLHEKKIMYRSQQKAKNIEDDKELLRDIWGLLDQADIVITQNGKAFDTKKLNARFILNGFKPPSSYKQIDTLLIAKKHFGFTSNKLEYMTNKLCKKYKKLTHGKFAGFELWKECLAGNPKAWREMEKYNKHDVLALEELYYKLAPWDNSVNFSAYDAHNSKCKCGSNEPYIKAGFAYTSVGKFQRYACVECRHEVRDRTNLNKGKNLKVPTNR